MIVLSNIFRGNHLQNQMANEINVTDKDKHSRPISQSSLRLKKKTKTVDNINNTVANGLKKVNSEKCISNSVDTLLTHREGKEKVICSAKGLLETNLDDIFNDVHDAWNQPKSLGTSEPILRFNDNSSVDNRESYLSEESEDTSVSDCTDIDAREQRKCMGARRFGHLLRRVISRNEFLRENSVQLIEDSMERSR
ncbi:unnamed protein product [Pieris brassicae]|uniref:Uncharacterized protein n=1 Tax=Pieris brassicae TaxID=7116 RepID=A0A9P0TMV7_PIEBR|nr:unnamed protein product [Pieris brassicae]